VSAPPSTPRDVERAEYLPDFCAPGVVLAVVLISELVAVVLTLGQTGLGLGEPFWSALARSALFLLWVGLASAAVLCYGRPMLVRMSVTAATASALGMLVLVTAVVSEAGWWLSVYWNELGMPPGYAPASSGHAGFLLRNMAIAMVVSALALRYFYVSHHWRRNVELEATARVNALQARIRPHFLFNSLNTIASLTRRDPAMAEEAIEDLADLFRASLKDSATRMSLKEELEIARLYQRIEQLRLGDRLAVRWNVDALPLRVEIPGLSLQPLLENAIYHGIEPRAGGGEIVVNGARLPDGRIEVSIVNPLPGDARAGAREGNRMALKNISERFRIAYGDRGEVEYGPAGSAYRVVLRFPDSSDGRS
jgi:two-component system sensor histidine kinase AlgZ